MKRAAIAALVVLALVTATGYRPTAGRAAVEQEYRWRAVYVNTGDVSVEPGATVVVPVTAYVPADCEPVVVGWQLGVFADDDNEARIWVATAKLQIDGQLVSHVKGRESQQGPLALLPPSSGFDVGSGVVITLNLKNRDTLALDGVRANGYVYFPRHAN